MLPNSAGTYVSVDFLVPLDRADDAAGILIADGALGCEVRKVRRHARTASTRNNPVRLCAYFERITPAKVQLMNVKLLAAGMVANGSTAERGILVDPGWATMWQKRFAPFHVGRRFLVVPPWQRECEPERIQLVIRPGQAFGTGHHPSTSGTLAALEELHSKGRVARALDVGTGSGILAIAMVKSGVTEVTALDIDATAIANAKENARLNRVSSKIRFSTTPIAALVGQFGLITANILSSALIRMAPELKERLRRRGYLVLAGILRREAQAVTDAYVPELSRLGAKHHGAWTTLILQK